jgi:hypothetical protein
MLILFLPELVIALIGVAYLGKNTNITTHLQRQPRPNPRDLRFNPASQQAIKRQVALTVDKNE